jgi:hypothetical protein
MVSQQDTDNGEEASNSTIRGSVSGGNTAMEEPMTCAGLAMSGAQMLEQCAAESDAAEVNA